MTIVMLATFCFMTIVMLATFCFITIVMLALYLTIYEILANQVNCKKDLANRDQGQRVE